MALKRILSTKWRLFAPRALSLIVILICMALWQVYHERNYRQEFLAQQLQMATDRVADCLTNGQDVTGFLRFVENYYTRNKVVNHMRLSVYKYGDWEKGPSTLKPVELNKDDRIIVERDIQKYLRVTPDSLEKVNVTSEYEKELPTINDGKFVYLARTVIDKKTGNRVIIIGALPNDAILSDYLESSSRQIWILVIVLAIISITVSYLTVNRFSRNIKLLREVAKRSVEDNDFVPGDDFPRDELGDIARQIVSLYNARTEARTRLEREHEVAMHAIEEKSLQKRQLTNNINHELKTPIGVIKGYLDILDNETLDTDTQRHFITKAREHADRLVNLMQDVSAITRLEEGQSQIATERLDLHEIVYTMANDFNVSGVLGKMQFIHEIPLGTYVRGNYNLLVSVIQNLAKNAANYSRGTKCYFEATASDDDFFYLRFYDDGVGVSPEHLDHIFDRFYRIDSGRARKSGGTGLGLAIVYNSIIAHRGTIKAGLHPVTGGLMIEFSLPRWQ